VLKNGFLMYNSSQKGGIMENKLKNPVGRPRTLHKEEIMDKICEIISTSNKSLPSTLIQLKQEHGIEIGNRTVWTWLDSNPKFQQDYARAKETQSDYLVDEMLDIADDIARDEIEICDAGGNVTRKMNNEYVQRSRLRLDTRKWIASKLKPKKYGEKLELGTGDGAINIHVTYGNKP
jgi:hypothetical protein